eukprot:762961-Hanusia_phi.AAC.20
MPWCGSSAAAFASCLHALLLVCVVAGSSVNPSSAGCTRGTPTLCQCWAGSRLLAGRLRGGLQVSSKLGENLFTYQDQLVSPEEWND